MRAHDEGHRGPILGDRYEILETLGAGRQATIYLAYDHVGGRSVAVKTDALIGDGRPSASDHEAYVLGGMDHPGVVRLLDTVEVGGALGLVLELAAGGSVRDWMRRHGPLDPVSALEIALQVASAAEHVHARGVLHRDLKPANVLVRSDGTVVLADFGVARDLAHGGGETGVGTPNFMAPEQQLGLCEVDLRCDVYGLGATLHRMLTNRAEPWLFRCGRAPHLLRGVPAPVGAVVASCCRPDPRDRPADMAAVRGRLVEALRAVAPTRREPVLDGPWPRVRPADPDVGVRRLRALLDRGAPRSGEGERPRAPRSLQRYPWQRRVGVVRGEP